ncbi:C4-dicarboxylate ABC transporter [Ottowia testudinis]|uniref:C4-dicarboxylate ABC transporter n=1 Tax=Ottowia testudinis TaxID=2816950 RepID=A0A975CIM8_9BURK|nr:C4-dicarboxylate ABC transporter [Ottowia testudinis]QTD45791.1 C4-dicarboxylate ABC transporter [Ottowia testudinis]
MAQGPDALKHLAPNWFAIVMGLCGLSLAWGRAAPILGDMASGGALVLAGAAALMFVALAVLSLIRWQHYPEALAADLKHPVRHALIATVPVSLILLATCGVSLLGTSAWLAALWWAGSLAQFGVTLWVATRWLSADKAQSLSWPALTPVMLIPVVGNVLAPLAGVSLGAGAWATAQFGIGLLLWPVLLALIFARIAAHGMWPERLLPATFISIAPPAVIGSAALQLGGPPLLAWMCWGIALLFVLWSLQIGRRLLAQPFSIGFWSMGFPLAAFATLTLRLAQQHGAAQAPAMIALALASLVIVLLGIATWKGWREGSLLQPEPVALIAVAGSGQPPQPQ